MAKKLKDLLAKPMLTQSDLKTILKEKEAEWKFNFLKQFKANLSITTDAFDKLLKNFINIIQKESGSFPPQSVLETFIENVFGVETLKNNKSYDEIYTQALKKLPAQREIKTAQSKTAPVKTAGGHAPPAQVKIAKQDVHEVIFRTFSVFSEIETQVLTLLFKRSLSGYLLRKLNAINPQIAAKIKGANDFADYAAFFPFMNKLVNPDWINDETIFEAEWRGFAEICRTAFLNIKKGTTASTNIRPGIHFRNFTKSSFYGFLVTAEFCSNFVTMTNLTDIFNTFLKYITLAFEKDPDEIMSEIKFINQPYTIELIKYLFEKVQNTVSDDSGAIVNAMEQTIYFNSAMNSPYPEDNVYKSVKNLLYLALITNYSIIGEGNKTSTGYVDAKGALILPESPKIIKKTKALMLADDWKIDKEMSELALQTCMCKSHKSAYGASDEWIVGNFIRGILKSIKIELPVLYSSSLVKAKNVKQGMDRELSEERYFKPVINFLMSEKENIINTLKKHVAR